jgi:phosphoribosyl 1,2-cyclic phosphate phosphodiesterase
MECIILGCGSSNGVPQIGCNCITCSSQEPKNQRSRVSILIKEGDTQILVDSGPDFRTQALRHGITNLDGVLYTHGHSDHVAGIDDLKPITFLQGKITAYMSEETYQSLSERYSYVFSSKGELYQAFLASKIINYNTPFKVGTVKIMPYLQWHGDLNSTGYRFGDIAYSTDLSDMPAEAVEQVRGVHTLILDCLRYHYSPTHGYLDRTFDLIAKIQPKRTILTHMGHEIEYHEMSRILPPHIELAYDGMIIKEE